MPEAFYLYNTTRSPHTRGQRRQLTAEQRNKKNLIIGGGSLSIRRGRPHPVSSSLLTQHLREITSLSDRGLLKVTDGRQRLVDLSTMKVVTEPPKVSKTVKAIEAAVLAKEEQEAAEATVDVLKKQLAEAEKKAEEAKSKADQAEKSVEDIKKALEDEKKAEEAAKAKKAEEEEAAEDEKKAAAKKTEEEASASAEGGEKSEASEDEKAEAEAVTQDVTTKADDKLKEAAVWSEDDTSGLGENPEPKVEASPPPAKSSSTKSATSSSSKSSKGKGGSKKQK